jgi:hypothetical protein
VHAPERDYHIEALNGREDPFVAETSFLLNAGEPEAVLTRASKMPDFKNNPVAIKQYACALYRLDGPKESEPWFERQLQLATTPPLRASALTNRGVCRHRAGDAKTAFAMAAAAIRTEPRIVNAWLLGLASGWTALGADGGKEFVDATRATGLFDSPTVVRLVTSDPDLAQVRPYIDHHQYPTGGSLR